MVTDWLTNPFSNHGLQLSYKYSTLCYICNDQVTVDISPQWTKNDIKWLDPANPAQYNASEGSGIMLQITYSPPTLVLNQPLLTDLPSLDEKIYADTYHAFLPPSSGSTWTAIAVKGIDQVISGPDLIDKAAGNLSLTRGCTDPFAAGCITSPSQGDFYSRPNFLLARGNPAATDLEAWVDPPNLATPKNANLNSYLIDAVPSENITGNPSLVPGTEITVTEIMTTGEILHVKNLNLSPNSTIGVSVYASSNQSR